MYGFIGRISNGCHHQGKHRLFLQIGVILPFYYKLLSFFCQRQRRTYGRILASAEKPRTGKRRKRPILSDWSFSGGGGRIRTIEAKRSRFTVCPLWPLGNSPRCSIVNVVRTELLKYSIKKRIVKKKYQIREKYFSIETAEISDGKYDKKLK